MRDSGIEKKYFPKDNECGTILTMDRKRIQLGGFRDETCKDIK